MPPKDQIRVGGLRISRSKMKKRFYWLISIFIVILFVSTLVYSILFGRSPGQ
jgi:hypothetical protein